MPAVILNQVIVRAVVYYDVFERRETKTRRIVYIPALILIALASVTPGYGVWSPSARGLIIGAGFGFASGPAGADDFAGRGGYLFVGRALGGYLMVGGKFEGYVYYDSRYNGSYDSAVDQTLYEVGFSSRFYPVGFFGLRPYVGGDAGVYVRVKRDDVNPGSEGLDNTTASGVTGRAGLEVFIVNSVAADFGASYSLDATDRDRLSVLVGYAGAVVYF